MARKRALNQDQAIEVTNQVHAAYARGEKELAYRLFLGLGHEWANIDLSFGEFCKAHDHIKAKREKEAKKRAEDMRRFTTPFDRR